MAPVSVALNAALESGRVRMVCPDTPAELLEPSTLALRINKENA
jgi:hypothetical protein